MQADPGRQILALQNTGQSIHFAPNQSEERYCMAQNSICHRCRGTNATGEVQHRAGVVAPWEASHAENAGELENLIATSVVELALGLRYRRPVNREPAPAEGRQHGSASQSLTTNKVVLVGRDFAWVKATEPSLNITGCPAC
jgi:hypothetical protein